MPRVQIYLSDDLHQAVKELGLPISELSQQAVRMELRRRELNAAADRYLAELAMALGGPPTADELAAAEAWIDAAAVPSARRPT
jgi:post-segregation antitoxin (ccd killing protein)